MAQLITKENYRSVCYDVFQKFTDQWPILTAGTIDNFNSMTIGWGMVGIEWGKPLFLALVRDSRHTMELLKGNGEFTVNIPMGELDKKILGVCGSKSGRDMDKISSLGLTLEAPDQIGVPGIRELPLTLECKVLYRQRQDSYALPQDIIQRYYPGEEHDRHVAFYAQIVSAYIIEE
jgi:flavin reductase (DIM6/NTAB) family NADH-FMN oxidoreductase RutF